MKIRIGVNDGVFERFTGVGRTKEQIAAVHGVVSRPDFAFACINPDWPGGKSKKPCAFAFVWYDTAVVLHLTKITPTGRITREIPKP